MYLKIGEATMNELAPYYIKLLHHGLLSIREAAYAKDIEWVKAQTELLHNVPSLIDETNTKRHEYFWVCERQAYIEWIESSGGETPRKRMRIYYEPIWQEMEPLMTEVLSARTVT